MEVWKEELSKATDAKVSIEESSSGRMEADKSRSSSSHNRGDEVLMKASMVEGDCDGKGFT